MMIYCFRCFRLNVLKLRRHLSNVDLYIHKVIWRNSSSVTLDVFTEELVDNASKKWVAQNISRKVLHHKKLNSIGIEIQDFKRHVTEDNVFDKNSLNQQIIVYFKSQKYDSVRVVLEKCNKVEHYPPVDLLTMLVIVFGRIGDVSSVELIRCLCKSGHPGEYTKQSGYLHYLAQALWVSGHIKKSVEMFTDVYNKKFSLQKKIKTMIRCLLREDLMQRGEAALVIITDFAKEFAASKNDYYFLVCLWQYCFLSEWFADQQLALKFLEEDSKLLDAVKERIPIIASFALRRHDTDTIYRLLELVLHFNLKSVYEEILLKFFDYKCQTSDLEGCSRIMKSALEHNVKLTASQLQMYFSMSLDPFHRINFYLADKKRKPSPIQYKF